MSVYLVTWDLNKEKSNYSAARQAFLSKLMKLDCVKDPGLDSVYFVSSNSASHEIHNYLMTELDANDRLIVSKIENGKYSGWLNSEIVDWLNQRV